MTKIFFMRIFKNFISDISNLLCTFFFERQTIVSFRNTDSQIKLNDNALLPKKNRTYYSSNRKTYESYNEYIGPLVRMLDITLTRFHIYYYRGQRFRRLNPVRTPSARCLIQSVGKHNKFTIHLYMTLTFFHMYY
jgi:hypothetical protein